MPTSPASASLRLPFYLKVTIVLFGLVLLGVLGAVLNLIPYVGSIVATIVPMLLALATKDSLWYPAAVLGLFVVVQLIDNELLVPRVVAARVRINALAAVLAVLLGNLIGGVAGMFLALPTLAVLKTIFDRVPALRPWGLLLSDQAAALPAPVAELPSAPARQPAVADEAGRQHLAEADFPE